MKHIGKRINYTKTVNIIMQRRIEMLIKYCRILIFGILALTVASIFALILEYLLFDKLSIRIAIYSGIINLILLFILLISIKSISKDRNIIKRNATNSIIIPKGKIIDTYIEADKDILSKYIKSVHPWQKGILRIMMELIPDMNNHPLKLHIVRKRHSNIREQEIEITQPHIIGLHIININVDPNDTINFKFNRNTLIKSMYIDELYLP